MEQGVAEIEMKAGTESIAGVWKPTQMRSDGRLV